MPYKTLKVDNLKTTYINSGGGFVGVGSNIAPAHTLDVSGDLFANRYFFGQTNLNFATGISIDFNGPIVQTISITGSFLSITGVFNNSLVANELKATTVRLINNYSSGSTALYFNNDFRFLGGVPTGLRSGKMGIISFNSFGTGPNDTVCVYRGEGQENDIHGVPDDAVLFMNKGAISGHNKFTWNQSHLEISGHLYPKMDDSFDLGSGDLRWRDLYLGGNSIYLNSGKIDINDTGHFAFNTGLTVSGHVLPAVSGIYDLGTNELRWRDIYLEGNSIHLGSAEISVDAQGRLKFNNELINTGQAVGGGGGGSADISGNLFPLASGAFDIGSGNLPYRDLYVARKIRISGQTLSVASSGIFYNDQRIVTSANISSYISGITSATGSSFLSGHLIPSEDGLYDVGSASYRYRDAYVKDSIYLSGQDLNVSGGDFYYNTHRIITSENISGYVSGGGSVGGSSNISGHLIPSEDGLYDVGSGNFRYRDAYIKNSIKLSGQNLNVSGGDFYYNNQKILTEANIGAGLQLISSGYGITVNNASYIANGSQTIYSAGGIIEDANNLLVSIDGLLQRPSIDFIIASNNVVFQETPPASSILLIKNLKGAVASGTLIESCAGSTYDKCDEMTRILLASSFN